MLKKDIRARITERGLDANLGEFVQRGLDTVGVLRKKDGKYFTERTSGCTPVNDGNLVYIVYELTHKPYIVKLKKRDN